jgi:putative two-component system response regulator
MDNCVRQGFYQVEPGDEENWPYKILIVDDNPSHRFLEREILAEPEGCYEVMEAENGGEARQLMSSQEFDAILLDKNLPDADGNQLCEFVRNDLRNHLVPLIMVTGSNTTEDLTAGLNSGANDFVTKPFNPIELVSRIRSAVTHKRVTDELDSAESLLFALARMVEAKDGTTGDHCTRLSFISVSFGQRLGLGKRELNALYRGGVLHDIGKLGIPDEVLLKNGPLTDDEWKLMRQHTVIGARLCSGLRSMRETVPIIRYHHERWDGSGYPDGLSGDSIPLLARIFQIVDIYDALANERPYKKALAQDEIIRILEEETAKGWRDPELVREFIYMMKDSPEYLSLPKDLVKDNAELLVEDMMSIGLFGQNAFK